MANKKTVFKTKWFSIESEKFPKVSSLAGKPIYRMNLPDSVVILPFTNDGKIILIRQFRPVIKKYSLELPAGGMGKLETPAKAAARELLEETGYRAKALDFVGRGRTVPDRINNQIHVFCARGCTIQKKMRKEHGLKVIIATPKEFRHYVLTNQFETLGSLGVVLLVKWKLKIKELEELFYFFGSL